MVAQLIQAFVSVAFLFALPVIAQEDAVEITVSYDPVESYVTITDYPIDETHFGFSELSNEEIPNDSDVEYSEPVDPPAVMAIEEPEFPESSASVISFETPSPVVSTLSTVVISNPIATESTSSSVPQPDPSKVPTDSRCASVCETRVHQILRTSGECTPKNGDITSCLCERRDLWDELRKCLVESCNEMMASDMIGMLNNSCRFSFPNQ